jgi:phage replication initiation protein
MSAIFLSNWTTFADECHQREVRKKSSFKPVLLGVQNEYPTMMTGEEFAKLSLARVDTLINNMRVTGGRSPKFRRELTEKKISLSKNAVSACDTIVFDGRKPKLQTIRKPTNKQIAFIDWITVSFHVATINPKFVRTGQDDDEYMEMCRSAVMDLTPSLMSIFGKKYHITKQFQKGRNFYQYSFDIGEGLGFVCIGGQRNTVSITVSGNGLSMAQNGWEFQLFKFLENAQRGKITRIDLAHDDIKGEYLNIYELDKLESAGGFHCGGARSSVRHDGNWKYKDPSNQGLTLYVGNRTSGKMMRAYEKGKQLGESNSKWTRVEVEYKSADRNIPFDVLLNPSAYFMGAYPCFETLFQFETSEKIKTKRKTVELTLDHSFEVIKKQFGKYFAYFKKVLPLEEVIERVRHDDENIIPSRLILVDDYCMG